LTVFYAFLLVDGEMCIVFACVALFCKDMNMTGR